MFSRHRRKVCTCIPGQPLRHGQMILSPILVGQQLVGYIAQNRVFENVLLLPGKGTARPRNRHLGLHQFSQPFGDRLLQTRRG